MRVVCEVVVVGPGPGEAIVGIRAADGTHEEVIIAKRLVHDGSISVGMPLMREDGRVLVELPRESVSGRWRIWVADSEMRPEHSLQAAE